MPHFVASKIYNCGKHREKRRNCLKQAISPFLTMFSALCGTYFSYSKCTTCFSSDQSKILSSGIGLNLIIIMYTSFPTYIYLLLVCSFDTMAAEIQ